MATFPRVIPLLVYRDIQAQAESNWHGSLFPQ